MPGASEAVDQNMVVLHQFLFSFFFFSVEKRMIYIELTIVAMEAMRQRCWCQRRRRRWDVAHFLSEIQELCFCAGVIFLYCVVRK